MHANGTEKNVAYLRFGLQWCKNFQIKNADEMTHKKVTSKKLFSASK